MPQTCTRGNPGIPCRAGRRWARNPGDPRRREAEPGASAASARRRRPDLPGLLLPHLLPVELPRGFFLQGVVHDLDDAVHVDRLLDVLEAPGELDLRVQLAALVQRPDLLAVARVQELGRETAQAAGDIGDVAPEHAARVSVARGVDRLGQVDDHGTLVPEEHVVFRQVGVDDPRAEHAHDLAHEGAVDVARLLRRERQIGKPGGGVALGVGHELHQQHAVDEVVGLRHAHAGGGETDEGVHLGALPGFLLRLAAVAAALLHGTRAAAVLHPAAFGVVDALAEGALVGFLVDLRAAHLVAAADHVDHGFLAAHELAADRIDEAGLDERFDSFRDLQRRFLRRLGARPQPRTASDTDLCAGGRNLQQTGETVSCPPRAAYWRT